MGTQKELLANGGYCNEIVEQQMAEEIEEEGE